MAKITKKFAKKILVLLLAVILGVGSTVAVLAASNQVARTNISVTYHADNVSATVYGYYQVVGDATVTNLLNNSNGTSITFTASQQTQTQNLHAPANINLAFDSGYVIFTYVFTNNATRTETDQGYDIKITLTDNSIYNHMNVTYMTTSVAPSGTLDSRHTTMQSAQTTTPNYVYVSAGSTLYYQIMVEVANYDVDSSYTSTALNGLNWNLQHVDLKDGVDPGWVINNDNVLTAYNGYVNDLTIPSSVTAIGANVFENKTSITSMTIPSTVTSIGDRAFYGCTGITSMTINCPSNATLGAYSLFGVEVDSITITNRNILKGTHLAIGHYPQTYVGNTLNSTLEGLYNGGTLQTGLTATGDSYKVSSTASNSSSANQTYATVVEYAYNGEKYGRLASATPYSTNNGFSTGDSIVSGRTYWFKVEPISVKVMNTTSSTDSTKLTVIADAVICSHRYNKTVVAWKDNPEVRTYLNGGTVNGTSVSFYTESGLNNINAVVSTTIKNQAIGSYTSETSGAEYNTTDYVWCPSFWEMTQSSNGYATNSGTYDTARFKKGTDLAKATFLYGNTASAYLGNGPYWTRSAYSSSYVYHVFSGGYVYYYGPYDATLGVAPCFALNL